MCLGGCGFVFATDADGETPYSFTLAEPSIGLHPLSIKYYDRAGNVSAVVSSFDLTVKRRSSGGVYLSRAKEPKNEPVATDQVALVQTETENNQSVKLSATQKEYLTTLLVKINQDFKTKNENIITVVKNPNLTLTQKRTAITKWFNNQTTRLQIIHTLNQLLANY